MASNLNFVAGQSVANLVIATVGASGQVDLYNDSVGTVALIADVSGCTLAGAPVVPGAFGSLAPARVLDTRTGAGAPQGAVAAGGVVHPQVTGAGGVPASGVSAVVLNVTVTDAATPGWASVYPGGSTRPLASNLNFVAGQTVANLVIAPVGASGQVGLFNGSAGSIAMIADVSGWFMATGTVAPPGPVTAVTGTPASTSVALSWTNPTQGSLVGVMIRRAVGATAPASATAGTLVTDTASTATSYTDTALSAGTQYSYALFAHDATPVYAAAATVTSTTTAAVTPPGPVTAVTATPASTSIALSWTNPTQGSLTGVMIRRAVGATAPASATAGTLVTDTASTATSYTDSGLSVGGQPGGALGSAPVGGQGGYPGAGQHGLPAA